MPTDIYFAVENVRVRVDEEPGQVAEAFASAGGLPFRLTAQGGHGDVYVNPSTVAFWLVSDSGQQSESPAEAPEESAKGRAAVTDLWGQPIRRKPRR